MKIAELTAKGYNVIPDVEFEIESENGKDLEECSMTNQKLK